MLNCDSSIKPFIGKWFQDFETALGFYKEYGRVVGFGIRKNTIKLSRGGKIDIVSNREGSKNIAAEGKKNPPVEENNNSTADGGVIDVNETQPCDNNKRRRVSNRVNCKAKIILKTQLNGGFKVHQSTPITCAHLYHNPL